MKDFFFYFHLGNLYGPVLAAVGLRRRVGWTARGRRKSKLHVHFGELSEHLTAMKSSDLAPSWLATMKTTAQHRVSQDPGLRPGPRSRTSKRTKNQGFWSSQDRTQGSPQGFRHFHTTGRDRHWFLEMLKNGFEEAEPKSARKAVISCLHN